MAARCERRSIAPPHAGRGLRPRPSGESPGMMRIHIKRVYDKPGAADGARILVDRMWPRGVSKSAAKLDDWIPDLAPSNTMRTWFDHDAARWREFKQRYFAELAARGESIEALRRLAMQRRVTLLYAARDERHNNAVALRDYLLKHHTTNSQHPKGA